MPFCSNPHQSAKLVTGDKKKKWKEEQKQYPPSTINRKALRPFYIHERGSLKMTDEGSFEVLTGRFLRIIDVELIWL